MWREEIKMDTNASNVDNNASNVDLVKRFCKVYGLEFRCMSFKHKRSCLGYLVDEKKTRLWLLDNTGNPAVWHGKDNVNKSLEVRLEDDDNGEPESAFEERACTKMLVECILEADEIMAHCTKTGPGTYRIDKTVDVSHLSSREELEIFLDLADIERRTEKDED